MFTKFTNTALNSKLVKTLLHTYDMYNICKTPPPERTSDQESLDLKVLPTLVYDQSCIHVVSTNMAQAWERTADGMERGQGEAETLSPTEEVGGRRVQRLCPK